MLRLTGGASETDFLDRVMAMSGQDLLRCLQCGKCSGSCPITSRTVGGPRRLIAEILGGMETKALEDPTWWYCVSCGTCANRCPVEINMYAVSTVLCEIASEKGIKPSEPAIHLFEELFLKSVETGGRVHELQTVMRFNLKSFHPFKDAAVGMRMMLRGVATPAALLRGGPKNESAAKIFHRVQEKRPEGMTP
jgi:heterodisulfide reductase subunit C2